MGTSEVKHGVVVDWSTGRRRMVLSFVLLSVLLFLRARLIKQLRLALNSPCSCLRLLSPGTTGVCHL